MEEGKLPFHILEQLLYKQGYSNPGIIMGPGLGLDAAVIDFEQAAKCAKDFYNSKNECYLILKTDPITFPTPNPGKYAVIVCANDIATTGAIPYGFGATIIFPPRCTKEHILAIQNEIDQQCKELETSILGGHTEISSSVNNPIICGTMIGLVPSDYYITRNIKPKQKIIVSGTCGMEGTSILIQEGQDKLVPLLKKNDLKIAAEFEHNLSIGTRALTVNKEIHPSLIHDATEGGVLGALYEAIAPAGLGVQIEKDLLPVSNVTKQISETLNIDPLQLISSGTMILVVDEAHADYCVQILRKHLPAEIVGEVMEKDYGIRLDNNLITPPGPDQIIKGLKNLETL